MELPPLSEGSGFYTLQQVALWLQVNEQSVRNWCRSDLLKSYKVGDLFRIAPSDLEAFVASCYGKKQTMPKRPRDS